MDATIHSYFTITLGMRLSLPFASVPAAVPRPLRERDLGNGKEWNGYLIDQ